MCNTCGWEGAIDDIEGMRGDKRYEFADGTLSGISDWVEKEEHVTQPQLTAIANIQGSVD